MQTAVASLNTNFRINVSVILLKRNWIIICIIYNMYVTRQRRIERLHSTNSITYDLNSGNLCISNDEELKKLDCWNAVDIKMYSPSYNFCDKLKINIKKKLIWLKITLSPLMKILAWNNHTSNLNKNNKLIYVKKFWNVRYSPQVSVIFIPFCFV